MVRAVGKKELQISENEKEEKPGAEQLVLQKDESANNIIVSLKCFAFKSMFPSCMFYFMKLNLNI